MVVVAVVVVVVVVVVVAVAVAYALDGGSHSRFGGTAKLCRKLSP